MATTGRWPEGMRSGARGAVYPGQIHPDGGYAIRRVLPSRRTSGPHAPLYLLPAAGLDTGSGGSTASPPAPAARRHLMNTPFAIRAPQRATVGIHQPAGPGPGVPSGASSTRFPTSGLLLSRARRSRCLPRRRVASPTGTRPDHASGLRLPIIARAGGLLPLYVQVHARLRGSVQWRRMRRGRQIPSTSLSPGTWAQRIHRYTFVFQERY